MTIELDHAIVPAHDRRAAAERLAQILGVPWSDTGVGPFCPVYVSDGLTLDFDTAEGAFPVLHYCFRVSDDTFDAIVARLRTLGVAEPKVAVVAAVETVTEAIQATVDARTLVESALDGAFGPALVEGPFGFDNAFSAEAARIKGLKSQVAGDADLMLMPDLNAGNMLYKSFVYVGGAECAGLVLGVQVPVILTSRADSQLSRLASVALAVLAGRDERSRDEG